MFSRRAVRALVVAAAMTLFLGACAPGEHSALEPLRGPDSEVLVADPPGGEPVPGLGADGQGVAADSPEGFGEASLDEMELPPDAPPPPIEGGSAPGAPEPQPAHEPAPEPEPAPTRVANPPASTPVPSGGSSGVAAAADYCTLWTEYGSVMAAVDSALYSGSGVPAALGLAAEVHDRAAELDSGLAAEHRRVATAMRGLESLLGSYGYDVGRLLAAVESDASVAARFEATQVDDSLDRTTEGVFNRCGVSLV